MRVPVKWAMSLCAVVAVGVGCDWRDFDNLQKQAPVQVVSAPSGYPSSGDFGSVLLPFDGWSNILPPEATFLVSGTEQTGLAVVTVDSSGATSATTITGQPALDALAGNNPITSMAAVPYGVVGSGTLAGFLGAPTLSTLLMIDTEVSASEVTTWTVTQFRPASTALANEPGLGVGVAVGIYPPNFLGDNTVYWIAASYSSVHVFPSVSMLDSAPLTTDVSPTAADLASCPITLSSSLPNEERISRAVAYAGAVPTTASPLVFVGTPSPSGPGTVAAFQIFNMACAFVLTGPMTTDQQFGRALAVGDFDHDGYSDLLVGAPPTRAYLYRGPVVSGAAPTAVITGPTDSFAFGTSVAAFDVDGVAGDEAVIGDPQFTVGGAQQAGSVFIYNLAGAALTPTLLSPVLADHEASTGESFGSAVAGLPYCNSIPDCSKAPRLPLVGAVSKAFVTFTLGQTDPRFF